VVSCTFRLNISGLSGGGTGGIGSSTSGSPGDDGVRAAGGLYHGGADTPPLYVRNTLVAANVADLGSDVGGAFQSGGFNLIGITGDGALVSGFDQPTDILGQSPSRIDARFGPIDYFGGTTPVQSLLTDSPAIDKGHAGGTTTDQRGFPRPADDPLIPNALGGDGSDIGAYEVHQPMAIPALSIRLGLPTGGFNNVTLSWPNPSLGYVLQQTANMSGPSGGWTDVPQTPVVNGANKEVTLLATDQFSLFRLRKL
jgi:hypothetical protein